MKRIMMLLVLVSVLSATVEIETCSFRPDPAAPEAVESFETAMFLVTIAVMISVAVVALSFMAGKAFSNPKLLMFSKDELGQLLITVFLAVSIVGFFEGSCLFFDSQFPY